MRASEERTEAEHDGPLIRAAQYVRMSTEHQKYSTENQAEIIAQYAARRGFEIVKTYEDSGKSGLKLEGRLALQQLIDDVRDGRADFEAVLVYDVSRWGRFQDADESACDVTPSLPPAGIRAGRLFCASARLKQWAA